jgi:anti-anti-sigma factor
MADDEEFQRPIIKQLGGEPPIAVVVFEFNIDTHVAPIMREALQSALDAALNSETIAENGSPQALSPYLLVNLEKAKFVDSVGLGTLATARQACRQRGGGLYLCHLQPYVRRAFEITGMNRLMPLFATEEEAEAAIRQSHLEGK